MYFKLASWSCRHLAGIFECVCCIAVMIVTVESYVLPPPFLSGRAFLTFLLTEQMILQEPSERPFDLAAVPRDVKSHQQVEKKAPKDASQKAAADGGASKSSEAYEKLLNSIPQFAGFGKLFKVLQWSLVMVSSMVDDVIMMKIAI
jgi:hypothetical protein